MSSRKCSTTVVKCNDQALDFRMWHCPVWFVPSFHLRDELQPHVQSLLPTVEYVQNTTYPTFLMGSTSTRIDIDENHWIDAEWQGRIGVKKLRKVRINRNLILLYMNAEPL